MIAGRFGRSLTYGLVISAFCVILADTSGHVAVVRQAALIHETPTRMLTYAFLGGVMLWTVVMFVLLSVFAPRRRPGRLNPPGVWEGTYPGQRPGSRRRDWEEPDDPPVRGRRGSGRR